MILSRSTGTYSVVRLPLIPWNASWAMVVISKPDFWEWTRLGNIENTKKWMNEWSIEWTDRWMDGWMNDWVDEWSNKRMVTKCREKWENEWMFEEWMNEWIHVWMIERVSEWMNECMNECMHEWTNEWIKRERKNIAQIIKSCFKLILTMNIQPRQQTLSMMIPCISSPFLSNISTHWIIEIYKETE